MKRLDDGKVSLVEFLRSIKFKHRQTRHRSAMAPGQFADFEPHTPAARCAGAEDPHLIRSAN